MTKRAAVRLAVVTGAVALAVGFASSARAHTPVVHPECDGLHVSLSKYHPDKNEAAVTIDGVTTVDVFGATYERVIPWTPTGGHTWKVKLTVVEEGYDRLFQGVQNPCVTFTTSPTTLPTITTTTEVTPSTSATAGTTIPADTGTSATTTTISTPMNTATSSLPSASRISTPDTVAASTRSRTHLPDTGPPFSVSGAITVAFLAVLGGFLLYLNTRRPQ